MRRVRPIVLGLIGLAFAAAAAAAPPAGRPPVMPASELRPGMTGYGLTVFNGETPERFKVEILGVLQNSIGAGVDMIVARLDHERLRDIGVIAGMSGSPIYINDRLVGAVAYGESFLKVAIAGITPIEKMLEVYDRTTLQPPPRDVALGPVEAIRPGEPVSIEPKVREFGPQPVRIRLGDLPASARALFEESDRGQDARATNEITLKPLSVPVMVSSCSPPAARLVEQFLRPLGMEPVFAPMGSSVQAAETISTAPIVAGAAVGVPYLMGDLSAGPIGTVTYTDGKRLVAFGHPMSARGPVEFPLGAAQVVATAPSTMRPSKMAKIVALSGSIYQDRLPAVGGVIGRVPYMVPMTVRVIHETAKTDRTFNYRIADHRLFTPRWAMVALVESCTAGERAEGEMTASIHYRVETDDGRVIEKDNTAAGTMAAMTLSSGLLSDIAPIYSNEFQVRSVRKVSAEVHLRDGIRSADLESAFVDRSIVKPGETLRISAYVKPWRQEQQRITATLVVPPDLPNGRYNVAVCDARVREAAEIVRAPGIYRPKSFADVVRILDIQFAPDRLYVMLNSPEAGVTIDGREFDALPPSFQLTIGQLRDRERIVPTIGQIMAETSVQLPFVVGGSHVSQIEVDRRGGR